MKTATINDNHVIDFIRSNREPISIFEAAGDLHDLGLNGAERPRLQANQWKTELQRLVQLGKLIETNGMLSVPTETKQPIQQELF